MTKTLSKYINWILYTPTLDYHGGTVVEYTFFGDGEGDFEKIATKLSSRELLNEYRTYLLGQLEMVEDLQYNEYIIERETM